MIDLDQDELIFLEAVEIHGAGPIDEDEMRHAERLIAFGLIADLLEPHVESMEVTERGRHFLIGWRLSAAERRVLVACVRHDAKQDRRLEENPKAIRNAYFAYGAENLIARRLLAMGLLGDCSFAGAGADVLPNDLGRPVAKLCPEWDSVPIGKAS